MQQDELEAETTDTSNAPLDTSGSVADEELPIDPSINAGREAFGNVSDFGVQPNDLGAEDEAPRTESR